MQWPKAAAMRLLQHIRAAPVRPAVMAIYADLTEALSQDDLLMAQELLDELLTLDPERRGQRIYTVDDSLGAGQAARYKRMISDDPEVTLVLEPFPREALRRARDGFMEALAFLRTGAAELAGELDVLMNEIVLVDSRAGGAAAELGGVSSFYLWGAAFICLGEPPGRLALAEALAHEAAHSLLFGFTLGRPLVTNDAEQRYASPLRDDLRPMDGIVHAAYVIARMTWCMQQLNTSGLLTAAEAETAAAWTARNHRDFAAALELIDQHAAFTPTGHAAFAPAAAWMRETCLATGLVGV